MYKFQTFNNALEDFDADFGDFSPQSVLNSNFQ